MAQRETMNPAGEPALRTRLPVSVLMERRRLSENPWIDETWRAVGVAVGKRQADSVNPVPVVQSAEVTQWLWTGLNVELFPDEAESYYHNLMVGTPGCYVLVRPRQDGIPRPVLVSLSFDAGQAYQEGDETVHNVPLPPELYRATEAFVLAHYVPEKKTKRKRQDWKGGSDDARRA
jgi:hypothetical protein